MDGEDAEGREAIDGVDGGNLVGVTTHGYLPASGKARYLVDGKTDILTLFQIPDTYLLIDTQIHIE